MARTSKLLTKEIASAAESSLEELGKNGIVAIKLMAIISAHKYGITRVAQVFDITKMTLLSWIKHFGKESAERLKVQPGRGRKHLLKEEQEQVIQAWISQDSQITVDHLKQKIYESFGVTLSRATAHRLLKKLNLSYITPRPIHYKQDRSSLEEAKKKSTASDFT